MNLLRRQRMYGNEKKYISPDQLLPLIHRGEVTYIEFEEFIYFHYTFIKIIQLLRKDGKKIAVHVRKINNNIFSHNLVKESLSIWEDVDFIVQTGENFSLKNSEESFFSNTFFFGADINAHSQELLERRRSYYHSSLKQVSLSYPKYSSLNALKTIVTTYTMQKKKVGIVTGVFDVVHPGHIRFLHESKKKVDILIVMINSDLSANHQPKNRDHDRPVHRLHERVGVLNGLSVVDHIVPFDTDSAEKNLTELHEPIVYIKTVKDKERKSIQQEIAGVKAAGGKVAFISNLRNKAGSIISSTMLIKASRKKARDQQVHFEKYWSPDVQHRLDELIKEIRRWDAERGRLPVLRMKLQNRYDGSLKTCVQIEQDVIEEVIEIANELMQKLPEKRDYYSYLLPYLLGKILDLPIKIVALQYAQPGLPYGIINSVQRLGGKTIFFETKLKKLYTPIRFEEYYWKVMPHHTHFMKKEKKRSFATRIYAYLPLIHFSSIGLKILLEDIKHTHHAKAKNEIVRLFHQTLSHIDDLNTQISLHTHQELMSRRSREGHFPGVVAHGGAAILSPNHPRAENSASGIRHALQAGVEIVEIDVSVCKDGWMVSHDRLLDIGTTAKGLITDKKVKDLQQVALKLSNGSASKEKMITLEQALSIVKEERIGDPRPLYVKIDIKLSDERLEKQFISIITKSGIPLEKILVTTQIIDSKRHLKSLCPVLGFECNTVETNLYILAYQLMQDEFMIDLYSSYLVHFARHEDARTISLAQFVIENIGEKFSQKLISTLQLAGFQVQAWVASTLSEYLYDAKLGVDFVLIQHPRVINQALQRVKGKKL